MSICKIFGLIAIANYGSQGRSRMPPVFLFLFFLLFFLMFIFERDTHSVGREGQREGETQNPKQAPGSELSAQSPMLGSNSRTVREITT